MVLYAPEIFSITKFLIKDTLELKVRTSLRNMQQNKIGKILQKKLKRKNLKLLTSNSSNSISAKAKFLYF